MQATIHAEMDAVSKGGSNKSRLLRIQTPIQQADASVDELEMEANGDHRHRQMREEVRARGTKRKWEVQTPSHAGERIRKRTRRSGQEWMEGDGTRDASGRNHASHLTKVKGKRRRLGGEEEEEASQWYRGCKGDDGKRRKKATR